LSGLCNFHQPGADFPLRARRIIKKKTPAGTAILQPKPPGGWNFNTFAVEHPVLFSNPLAGRAQFRIFFNPAAWRFTKLAARAVLA
jgi:hypothetical protein